MDYGTFLLGLVAGGVGLRDRRLLVTSGVLLANLHVLSAYYELSGNQYDWAVNSLVDYASAGAVIVFAGRDRATALIVLAYAVALCWHLVYAFGAQDDWAKYHYWYEMSWTAWAQAMLAAAGGIGSGGRRVARGYRQAIARLGRVRRGVGTWAMGADRSALPRED